MRCSSCLISLPNRGALHRAWDLESFLDGKPPRIPKGAGDDCETAQLPGPRLRCGVWPFRGKHPQISAILLDPSVDWRPPLMPIGSLLVSDGNFHQRSFAPRGPHELQGSGKVVLAEAVGHGNRRHTGYVARGK